MKAKVKRGVLPLLKMTSSLRFRMSSEDKTVEPSDQGPSPPSSSVGAASTGSPAHPDKRPRGRPRKDACAILPQAPPSSMSKNRKKYVTFGHIFCDMSVFIFQKFHYLSSDFPLNQSLEYLGLHIAPLLKLQKPFLLLALDIGWYSDYDLINDENVSLLVRSFPLRSEFQIRVLKGPAKVDFGDAGIEILRLPQFSTG